MHNTIHWLSLLLVVLLQEAVSLNMAFLVVMEAL